MNPMIYNGNKNIIYDRLRKERERLTLTQEELAAKMQTLGVNMDQQMISKIERNRRLVTDYEVIIFAKALGIEPAALFDLDCME